MKKIFFTDDLALHQLAEELSDQGFLFVDSYDELRKILDEFDAIVFIDFDSQELDPLEVNEELIEEEIVRIIISEEWNPKDFLKHQKSKHKAEGYGKKPLHKDFVEGIVQDFLYTLEDNDEDEAGSGGFHTMSIDKGDTQEVTPDEDEEEELEKDLEEGPSGFEDPINSKIQSEFDLAQGTEKPENLPTLESDDGLALSMDETETEMVLENKLEIDSGIPLDLNEKIQKEFDLVFGKTVRAETVTKVTEERTEEEVSLVDEEIIDEATMSKEDEDIGLEFNIPDNLDSEETATKEVASKPSSESPVEAEPGVEDEGFSLEFNIDENGEEPAAETSTEAPAAAESSTEDSGGMDFDLGADEGMELGGDSDEVVSQSSDPEVSTGELDLSADDSGPTLDLGGEDDAPIETFEPEGGAGELDLGEEDSGPSLDLGGDDDVSISEPSDEASVGELDLGGAEYQEDDDSAKDGELGEINVDQEYDEKKEEITSPTISVNVDEVMASSGPTDDDMEVSGAPTDDDLESLTSAKEDETGDITIPAELNEGPGPDLPEEAPDLPNEAPIREVVEEPVDLDATLEFDAPVESEPEQAPIPEEFSSSVPEVPIPSATVATAPENDFTTLRQVDESELTRMQSIIKQLREEREKFIGKIDGLNTENQILGQENLTLKSELEETRCELEIIRKRRVEEMDEAKFQLRLSEDKAAVNEEKAKNLEKEFEKLQIRFREEVNKVRQREKELENQLELVSLDSENQVNARDNVILTLKRKIDSLEFNMENAEIKGNQSREDKVRLEEKLSKIMRTLRGSIKLLEDDLDLEKEFLDEIKRS